MIHCVWLSFFLFSFLANVGLAGTTCYKTNLMWFMLVRSSYWKCLSNWSTVIFFAEYFYFARSFWIVAPRYSHTVLLTERASKPISKQIKILTFRINHATFKFLRSGIFPVQITQMRENLLFQHINLFFYKEEANSFISIVLYFDLKTNFYGKFRPSLLFISKQVLYGKNFVLVFVWDFSQSNCRCQGG